MKKKFYSIAMLMLVIVLFKGDISYGIMDEINYINIKLSKPLNNNHSINLESTMGFLIYEENDKLNPIYIINEEKINCTLNGNGDISLIDTNKDVIFTLPGDNTYLLYGNGSQENLIKIEKDRYRGYLNLSNTGGIIRVINHIGIEEYLYGLVPREMPSNFPPEALKAQAVAARTYAIHNMDKHKNDGCNLCDTTHCQVYLGYDGEKPSTTTAVDETRGILAFYDGQTIDAQYHSSSGGYTNDSKDVWGGDYPYLKAVKDDFSAESPYSSWSISIDINDLNNRLVSNGINIGVLEIVEVSKMSQNGNVESLLLKGSLGNEEVKSSTFRNIVGNMDLKSTNFSIQGVGIADNTIKSKYVYVIDANKNIVSLDIKKVAIIDKYGRRQISASSNRAMSMNKVESLDLDIEQYQQNNYGSKITIEGKGFGHGVGMSQYGAKRMAELGYDFKEILKFYYAGIDIL